jgi:alginate O-acetyltransferase complex protein AlgI
VLFNSFTFLFLFMPLALLAYYLPARLGFPRVATGLLVLASLLFYADWGLRYLPLLIGSTVFNYAIGAAVRRHRHRGTLVFGIAANLLALGYFKYAAFAVQTANQLTGTSWPVPNIILPLAISFYTFTQIAFLVDCYKGQAEELNFSRYCLFVFFFPHLIAGPIVHHKELMPQFADPRSRVWIPENVAIGIAWLTLGLFKKVVIADGCAPWANTVFETAGPVPGLFAWAGALAYTFQLYFDFSGYSDMALGLSWFFNIRLPDNFDAPYRATSIIDFWRRWHMTLSRFLRDYLYIPLGGNRHGETSRYRNLFLTMVLGGLWHGAAWTFVIWGAYHGILLAACHLWAHTRWKVPTFLARSLTFLAVVIGWCFFRAPGFDSALQLLRSMFDVRTWNLASLQPLGGWQIAAPTLLALLVFVNLAPTTKDWVERRQLGIRHGILLALLFAICLLLMRDVSLHFTKSEFIYFNF